ncbi:MAG: hypothetical protein HYS40_09400 [Gemmatimonadetes bacterium]|nr:hypothetical protein [Gemmatimonadota bacterium]
MVLSRMLRERLLSRLLVVIGAGVVVVAVALDTLLPGATPGFGRGQLLLALAGGAVMASGGVLPRLLVGARLVPSAEELRSLGRFAALAIQLGLLVLVIREFRIESPAFYKTVVPLAACGFVVHHLLPTPFRLPFFLVLSLAGIGLVFGWTNGAWLLAVGLVLVGLCHAPAPFAVRVGLVAVVGVSLALMRSGRLPAPWSAAIWPILGSMFMFRLIVYLYDLRHTREPVNVFRSLSYFFLLPNVAFPLFPVVDFATFRRTYYDEDPYRIYQRGVRWMLLGTTHLVLYRFVYQYVTLSPGDIATVGDLARYLVANFLLYLRVSGQFHMIAGLLHLFGFRLPETHRFFFLASSFSDFWRRINIYWKDFMMKVFQYPSYFQLRRLGDTTALVLSTLLVFCATWILHSYQWFWLLGSVRLAWTDVLFWSLLAVLLVANSLYEVRHGRTRTLGKRVWSTRQSAVFALRTVGTFAVICVLWSLWTSPSLTEWFVLWGGVRMNAPELLAIVAVLAAAVLATTAAVRAGAAALGPAIARQPFGRTAGLTAGVLVAFYVVGRPELSSQFGPHVREVLRDVRLTELNKRDAALLRRGYYESIVGANPLNSRLWEIYAQRPRQDLTDQERITRPTGDFLMKELPPLEGVMFFGAPFRTNRWGMRDRDYERLPPPATYRVALLGSSYTMGWGVGDGQSFEWLLEDRLNGESRGGAARYEILNFAVGDYTPLQQVMLLERKVFTFRPNTVFLVAGPAESAETIRRLALIVRLGVHVPYDFLRETVQAAGVDSATPLLEAERRLKPHETRILAWAYGRIAALSRERGITPVWMYLPMPGDATSLEEVTALTALAHGAGFRMADLSDVYAGHDLATLQVAAWDRHPNAAGHRLIADRLYAALRLEPDAFGVPLPVRAVPGDP